jgi:MFS family permease
VAGAQILGGLLVPYVARVFRRRTTVLIVCEAISVAVLAVIGLVANFWVAVILLVMWGLMFAAVTPIRQAFLNALIPSQQRATVLSFDSLFGSTGGVVIQPVLGKAADVWGYPVSYQLCAAFQVFALPFTWLARREGAKEDVID